MEKNPTIAVLSELHNKITLELLAEKKAIEPCAIKLLTLSKIVESLNFILTFLASATSKNK